MARSSEVIRQWRLLREIEASRGVTIRDMAELAGVTTRTIRRDLDALQEAGTETLETTQSSVQRTGRYELHARGTFGFVFQSNSHGMSDWNTVPR